VSYLVEKSKKDESYDRLKCRCGRVEERNDMVRCCHQWWCLRCVYLPKIDVLVCPSCK
jgi:hypothetical protein